MMWLDEPPYVMRHTCRHCPPDCLECTWDDDTCNCQTDHEDDDDD